MTIMIENGAAAVSQSIQLTEVFICVCMKPTATRFCAAAVWIIIFQKVSACTAPTMSSAATRLLRSIPKFSTMPMIIGAKQAIRAVALGTKKARIRPVIITPK